MFDHRHISGGVGSFRRRHRLYGLVLLCGSAVFDRRGGMALTLGDGEAGITLRSERRGRRFESCSPGLIGDRLIG